MRGSRGAVKILSDLERPFQHLSMAILAVNFRQMCGLPHATSILKGLQEVLPSLHESANPETLRLALGVGPGCARPWPCLGPVERNEKGDQ